MTYSHLRPTLKQANVSVQDALAALNPTDSLLKDYAIYAGGGGLAGAGIGALVNALRGESKLKGALIGGGVGAGLGAGAKALGNYALSDQAAQIKKDKEDLAALRTNYPMRMGGGAGAQFLEALDALQGLSTNTTPAQFERRLANRINESEQQDLLAALKDTLSKKTDAAKGMLGFGG
jgi:hypothetical protein